MAISSLSYSIFPTLLGCLCRFQGRNNSDKVPFIFQYQFKCTSVFVSHAIVCPRLGHILNDLEVYINPPAAARVTQHP